MEKMKKVAKVLEMVRKTSSTKEKQSILQYESTQEHGGTLRNVLYYTYNPFMMFGLTDKTLQVTSPIQPITPQMMTYVKIKEEDVFLLLENLANNNINDSLRAEAKRLLMCIEDIETRQMVRGILVKDLKLGVNVTTLNKVFGKGFIPKFDVQLAESYSKQKPGSLREKEVCITEKLDGFRIVYNPLQEKFFTRKGQEYEGLEHLIPELNDLCVAISEDSLLHGEDVVIDGELVHEPVEGLNSQEVYALTSSAARKKGRHRDKLKLQFHVFDFVPVNEFMSGLTTLRYKARRNIMDKVFNSIGADLKHVRPVTVFYMGKFDEEILMSSLRMVESWGGEGLMINLMEGTYECKRTKKLLKVKTFKDADVLVTNVVEGTGKNLGKLGSIVVKYLYNGQEMYCDCGSGFNDIERDYFWEHPEELIGQVVELQYFEITQNAKTGEYGLRFPVWKGRIRKDKSPEDITDVATV